jgi:hypothetical protein
MLMLYRVNITGIDYPPVVSFGVTKEQERKCDDASCELFGLSDTERALWDD